MPYSMDNPPERIEKLPKHAQEIWIAAYNAALEQYDGDEEKANAVAWAAVEREYEQDTEGNWHAKKSVKLFAYGSAVKHLGGNKFGGLLVRFTPPGDYDLDGDRFDAQTDFGLDFSEGKRHTLMWFNHTFPVQSKKRNKEVIIKDTIGSGQIWKTEEGIEIIAEVSDEYLEFIRRTAKRLGWSSGAPAHLVTREREPQGGYYIKRWVLGTDASMTPTPAEPRNWITIKSLNGIEDDEIVESAEVLTRDRCADGSAEAPMGQHAEKTVQNPNPRIENPRSVGKMDEQATTNPTAPQPQDNTVVLDELKKLRDEIAALKSAPPDNAGGVVGAPTPLKYGLGEDTPQRAFIKYLRGESPHITAVKTSYPLLENTQYQGQEVVPTEVYNNIIQRRDPISIMRAVGAMVVPASSNAMVIPIEKASPTPSSAFTLNGTNTIPTLSWQPLDKLAATIYMFALNVQVDINLLDDSVVNLDGWLTDYLGRWLALTENKFFIPTAVAGSTAAVTAASTSALTAGEVISAYYKVPAEYRDSINWIMRGTTEASLRLLTSSAPYVFAGNGNFHGGVGNGGVAQGDGWLVSTQARVYNTDEMDAIGASKKPVLLGNFRAGFAVIDRKQLTVLRDPYSGANKGLVNLWFYARFGGGVVNPVALYHIVQPAS